MKAKDQNMQLFETLNNQKIQSYKQKIGPAFQDANRLQRSDANHFRDYIDNVELSDEFLKLASHDLLVFQKKLKNRLKPVPTSWEENGRKLHQGNITSSTYSKDKFDLLPPDIL